MRKLIAIDKLNKENIDMTEYKDEPPYPCSSCKEVGNCFIDSYKWYCDKYADYLRKCDEIEAREKQEDEEYLKGVLQAYEVYSKRK